MTELQRYEAGGFFLLRAPWLPFAVLERWGHGPRTAGQDLDSVIASLREGLGGFIERPDIREALFLASRSLVRSIPYWRADPDSNRGRKVEQTLVRYLSRMAGRPTSFGLFAGFSIGEIGKSTSLAWEERHDYKRVSRLSFRCVLALLEKLRKDPLVHDQLHYRPNPTLYRIGRRLRYVERRPSADGFSFFLSTLETTEDIERVLRCAGTGRRAADLVDELDSDGRGTNWRQLTEELIAAGVLVDDILPQVTGNDVAGQPARRLKGVDGLRRFGAAEALIRVGDERGIGLPASFYGVVERAFSSETDFGPAGGVFVDLVTRIPRLALAERVVAEIVKGVQVLHRIGGSAERDEDLEDFKARFRARYGEAGSEPLLEVLDPEWGIGFGSYHTIPDSARVLDGMGIRPRNRSRRAPWSSREDHLLRLLESAWRAKRDVIELSDADIAALTDAEVAPLPDSFCALLALEAASSSEIDAGDYGLLIKMVFGPSGASILGRLAGADRTLCRFIRRFLRKEEALRPEAIYAEIVHLPSAEAGDVVFRPVLRSHEIPIWGGSGAPSRRQVALSDLGVGLRDDRIVLFSQGLSREIIPRLSCAHNYKLDGLGIYRFLCTLQHQGVNGLTQWSWGPLESAAFLPRVTLGRLVFSRSRWRLDAETISTWRKLKRSELHEAVGRWRHQAGLPRFVLWVSGDRELPIDIENPLSVESLILGTGGRRELILEEMLPAPGRLPVGGQEGQYVHEIVLPIVAIARKPSDERRMQPMMQPMPMRKSEQTLQSWSRWMYVRLHTGEYNADIILTDLVGPHVARLKEQALVDRWHFVRFADPHPHLRIRMHGSPTVLLQEGEFAKTIESLLREKLVYAVQIDTYEPEVERYGGPEALLLAEEAFDADSDSVVAILAMLRESGFAPTYERWKAVVRGVDTILSDFSYDLDAKRSLSERMRKAYREEFGVSEKQRHLMGERYREYRLELERWLSGRAEDRVAAFIEAAFQYRSARLVDIASRFRLLEQARRLTRPLREVTMDLMHMHANRMLPVIQREQELIVYDFLVRAYQSMWARSLPGSSP